LTSKHLASYHPKEDPRKLDRAFRHAIHFTERATRDPLKFETLTQMHDHEQILTLARWPTRGPARQGKVEVPTKIEMGVVDARAATPFPLEYDVGMDWTEMPALTKEIARKVTAHLLRPSPTTKEEIKPLIELRRQDREEIEQRRRRDPPVREIPRQRPTGY
jgi:hypothetical protein